LEASVQAEEMHYPVMTEKHVADLWQISLKTLRRWRLNNEGPVWHKLFRHRSQEAHLLDAVVQRAVRVLRLHREFELHNGNQRQHISPCAIVVPSGISRCARSTSTWLHWLSPVQRANASMRS
jgi:hypothetical protein